MADSSTMNMRYMFFNNKALVSIDMSSMDTESLIVYDDYMFQNCTQLKTVIFPDSYKSIPSYCFRGCTALTDLNISSNMTSISSSAYRGCTGLTSITIPSSITSIGNSAFEGCTGLTSVNIPSGVTSISNSTFEGCTGLTSVELHNTIKTINGGAFRGCTGLISITIPTSVSSINSSTLYGGPFSDTNLDIYVDSNNSYYHMSNGCLIETATNTLVSGTKSTTSIPNGVTTIAAGAFYNCTSLTSVTVPASVTEIEGYGLYDVNFESIIMLSTTPPTIQTTWYTSFRGSQPIVVPKGCGETYKAAEGWSKWADYITEAS